MNNLFKVFYYLIFLFSYSLAAQNNSFEYITSSPHDEYISDLIETQDGNIYYCGGYSALDNPNKRIGTVMTLDRYGVLIDSLNFNYIGKSCFFSTLIPSQENEFITLMIEYDTVGERKDAGFLLSRMDKHLNLFDSVHHFFPSNYRLDFLTATHESDGTTFIGGDVLNETNYGRPLFYEFDSNFDSVKAKIFLSELGEFTQIRSIYDGQYWAIRLVGSKICILDSTLNIVSKKRIPYSLAGNIGVKWDSDSSFYLVGDKLLPLPSHNLGFIRQFDPVDTAGIIFNQWGVSDTFDLPAIINGIDFKNKDSIYISGMRNVFGGYHNPWPSWFIILQTDSMLNIRWERFYGGDAFYLMGKIIASRDGGCIIGGMRYDYQNEPEEQLDIIILKLNENGIIVGDNENPTLEMQESIVYPNPGTNEIKVRIAAQHPESLFQLFDMKGKQIVSQEIIGKWGAINTGFLKSGTYIYRITSKQGLFESGKWVKR